MDFSGMNLGTGAPDPLTDVCEFYDDNLNFQSREENLNLNNPVEVPNYSNESGLNFSLSIKSPLPHFEASPQQQPEYHRHHSVILNPFNTIIMPSEGLLNGSSEPTNHVKNQTRRSSTEDVAKTHTSTKVDQKPVVEPAIVPGSQNSFKTAAVPRGPESEKYSHSDIINKSRLISRVEAGSAERRLQQYHRLRQRQLQLQSQIISHPSVSCRQPSRLLLLFFVLDFLEITSIAKSRRHIHWVAYLFYFSNFFSNQFRLLDPLLPPSSIQGQHSHRASPIPKLWM
jgi:hypothetical protein